MIKIGFIDAALKPHLKSKIIVRKGGLLVFRGAANIGSGSSIYVDMNAKLKIGNKFIMTCCSSIGCYKSITICDENLISWDCLIMDSDNHKIFDEHNNPININESVIIADKVWTCSGVKILKGTTIPTNCVIASNSLVRGSGFENNSIIAGCPAKSVKRIASWEI